MVGAVVAFVMFLLSSSISYLIAIRSEEDKNLADYAIAYRKNLSSIDSLPNADKSFAVSSSSSRFMFINDDFERKHRNQTIPSVVFSPTFRIMLISLTFILVYLGLLRFIVYLKNRKTSDGKQDIPIPLTIYISAATQTSFN